MADRYRPTTTPTGELAQTQRFLRQELLNIATSFDSAFDYIKRLAELTSEMFVYAGFGQIQGLDDAPLADIGVPLPTTWQTLPLDQSGSVPDPANVVYDPATDSMRIDAYGTWLVSAQVTLEHNLISNNARTVYLRLYDIDALEPGADWEFATGRNSTVTNMVVTGLANIAELRTGNRFVLQIGGTLDTYTNVVLRFGAFGVSHVSNYGGTIEFESPTVIQRMGAELL